MHCDRPSSGVNLALVQRCSLPVVALLLSVVLAACSTRTPENPTAFGGEFVPPVTADLVLENFVTAVNNVNTENYMLCLADATTRSPRPFVFEPSAEVRARYQALYDGWSNDKERQGFLAMRSRIRNNRPLLSLFNRTETFSSPDLKVFSMDYELIVDHDLSAIPRTLSGTMVLEVQRENTGLWSISRWIDARRSADTIESTWSLLKAQLSN